MFLGLIISLVLSLMCVLLIIVVSMMVYYVGDDEMEILFQMTEIDSRIFR